MPRFVVHDHEVAPGDDHWDLMLEVGPVLWTWSLPAPPPGPGSAPLYALQIKNHRPEFLEYEGDVSGGRGRTRIIHRGTLAWREVPESRAEVIDRLEFRLEGPRLWGWYRLERVPAEGKDLWRLRRLRDPP